MKREIITIDEKEYAVLPVGDHLTMTHAIFANGEIHNGESSGDPLHGFWVYHPKQSEYYECDKANLYGIKPLEFIARIPEPKGEQDKVVVRRNLMELCGGWLCEYPNDHEDMVRIGDRKSGEFAEICWWRDWNPVEKPEQLKICYLALEKKLGEYDAAHNLRWTFCRIFQDRTTHVCGMYDMVVAWAKYPEMMADAILEVAGTLDLI
jgi:hypothetical protein